MNYHTGLGSNPRSATKLGWQTSAQQDSMASSVNGDVNGVFTEKKQAQDPAPHPDLGHVEPSDSTMVPSPSPGPEF